MINFGPSRPTGESTWRVTATFASESARQCRPENSMSAPLFSAQPGSADERVNLGTESGPSTFEHLLRATLRRVRLKPSR